MGEGGFLVPEGPLFLFRERSLVEVVVESVLGLGLAVLDHFLSDEVG